MFKAYLFRLCGQYGEHECQNYFLIRFFILFKILITLMINQSSLVESAVANYKITGSKTGFFFLFNDWLLLEESIKMAEFIN